jgi:hypothetical protein
MKSLFKHSIFLVVLTVVVASCGSDASNSSHSDANQEGLSQSSHHAGGSETLAQQSNINNETSTAIMKIADVVANAKTLEGKEVTIQGEITKVNSRIMGRNWIHLKDGSKDDYDLVVTSKEVMNIGENVTLTCLVALNKDFGAGYTYDLILEDARRVK